MKVFVAFLSGFLCFFSSAQTDLKLWVGISKSQEFREIKYVMYKKDKQIHTIYQLNIGTMLFDKLNVVADLGFKNIPYVHKGGIYKNSSTGNFKTFTLGLGVDYRFFKSAVFSPKIAIAGGFTPYSNLKNRNVEPFSLSMDANSPYLFETWKSYSSVNCFLSLKLSELYIDVGGGVNWQGYSIKYEHFIAGRNIDYFGHGWDWKIKLGYVFNKKGKGN